jgi:hypothetical protein
LTSRAVLAAAVDTIDSGFASKLEEALARHGKPRIFNTDQGAVHQRRVPASLKPLASRFRWTGTGVSWTTFSSNACGLIKYECI